MTHPSMDDRARRIAGLLAHSETQTRRRMDMAYHDNPTFHLAVNVIENAIPIFMESLLESAEQTEAILRRLKEANDTLAFHPLRNPPA